MIEDYENFHDSYEISYYYNKDISINNEKNIKILYLNIRSMQNKLNDLELLVDKYGCNVVVVSESWLNNGNKMFFNIKGFNAIHSVRNSGPTDIYTRGGGVSLFVSDKFKFNLLYEKSDICNNFLGVHLIDLNINIFGIYRSNDPSNNLNIQIDNFFNCLDHITREFNNSIILGDFNLNLLDNSRNIIKYLSILNSNNFTVLNKINNNMITRPASENSGSIIDHVITDIFQFKYLFSVIENCISDHNIILLGVNNNKVTTHNKKITKTKYNDIILEIHNNDWSNIDSANNLQNQLTSIIKRNTIEIKIKNSKRILKPYITKDIISLINKRDRLFILTKKYPHSLIIKELFIKLRNKVSNLCKDKKKEYYNNLLNENYNNPRKLWSITNEVLYNKPNKSDIVLPSQINIDGNVITNKIDILNSLNHSFVIAGQSNFVFSDDHSLNTDLYLPQLFSNNEFQFKQISLETLNNIFKSMNKNAAAGVDLIKPKLLNAILYKINNSLLNIINKTFIDSAFPQTLKEARILPLFKSGDKNDPGNYRSLSILPSLSKPIEVAMNNQIMEYITENDIISKNQYGFIPESSTVSACISVVSELQNSLDKNLITACLTIDLRKAFDSVNHEVLLCKLFKYNFSPNAIKLIHSYLSQRTQKIVLEDITSNTNSITMGVPQGSILGPTLFNLYVNDIFELQLFGKISMYADDAMLTYSVTNINELQNNIQEDLNTLNNYFNNNSLQMNINKTNYIIFGKHSNNSLNLIVNQIPIKKVIFIKYLGLLINEKLSWDQHANHIMKSIAPYCGMLYKLNKILNKKMLFNIYFAHINGRLLYLNVIWSSIPIYKQKEIKVLQNKALKSIMSLPRLAPTHTLYNEKILPFELLSEYELMVLFYKIINHKIKHNLDIITNSEIHEHNTRYNSQLHVTTNNTHRFGKNSILNRGKIKYNALPEDLKNITNLQKFKIELKKYLMDS